jgi:hypothetical protein
VSVLGKPSPSDPATAKVAVGYTVFVFLRVGIGRCTVFACRGRRVHRVRMVQSLELGRLAWTTSWAWPVVMLEFGLQTYS